MLSEFKSQRRYQSWIEICYLINLLFVPKGFCLGRPVFTSPQNLLIPKSIFNSQTFSCEFLKARVLWACKQTALFTIHFSASHVLKYLTRERAFKFLFLMKAVELKASVEQHVSFDVK